MTEDIIMTQKYTDGLPSTTYAVIVVFYTEGEMPFHHSICTFTVNGIRPLTQDEATARGERQCREWLEKDETFVKAAYKDWHAAVAWSVTV